MRVGEHRRQLGLPAERRGAGQGVVKHAGQRVHVSAGVDRIATDLLRRHVVDGAEELAGTRELAAGAGELADPEVAQEGAFLALGPLEQDVRRLHVAVDETPRVSGIQRRGNLMRQGGGVRGFEPPALGEQLMQARAIDEAHDDVEPTVGLTRLVDRRHVGVLDRSRQPGLPPEPLLKREIVQPLGGEDLQCPDLRQRGVAGPVDHAHPAATHLGFDLQPGEHGARGEAADSGAVASCWFGAIPCLVVHTCPLDVDSQSRSWNATIRA